MEAIYLGVIGRKGDSNTRCLVFIGGKFHSVKVPNSDVYARKSGEIIEFDGEKLDDMPFRAEWLNKFCTSDDLQKKIRSHLEKYKKDVLKISEEGYWIDSHGEPKFYGHILPDDEKLKNLIASEYYNTMKEFYNKIGTAIHSAFKNLNSSQAMAINFFVPLVEENQLNALFDDEPLVFGGASCEFEKIVDLNEKTQFDFYIKTSEKTYSFEVKYSEEAFGFANMSNEDERKRHEEKWEVIYKNVLGEIISEYEFFENYQLWRNIFYALKDENHITCFVFPDFRGDLKETVNRAKEKCPDDVQERIKIIPVDTVVKKIRKSNSEKLKSHYNEFYKKYLETLSK